MGWSQCHWRLEILILHMARAFFSSIIFFKKISVHDIARTTVVNQYLRHIKVGYGWRYHQRKYLIRDSSKPSHYPKNLRACLYELAYEVFPSFLLTVINLAVFLFIMPLDNMLDLGAPNYKGDIFMLALVSFSLFSTRFFTFPPTMTSIVFLGDCLLFCVSSLLLLPSLIYSNRRPLLIVPLITFLSWMQSLVYGLEFYENYKTLIN